MQAMKVVDTTSDDRLAEDAKAELRLTEKLRSDMQLACEHACELITLAQSPSPDSRTAVQ
jgi:hypothetical protein